MVTVKRWYRDMKAANRYAKTHGGEIVAFEPNHGGVLVGFEFKDFDIYVDGRLFKVEKLAEANAGLYGATYRLTGLKGASFLACRAQKTPEYLYVIPDGLKFSNPMEGLWLTDKDGALKEAR